jgi:hypothetical protein
MGRTVQFAAPVNSLDVIGADLKRSERLRSVGQTGSAAERPRPLPHFAPVPLDGRGVDSQSYNEAFKTTLAPTQRLTRWGTLHLAACGVSGT